ncbi:MAG: hypothetical protein ACE5KE_08350 [Methanosarcinales archaeon]
MLEDKYKFLGHIYILVIIFIFFLPTGIAEDQCNSVANIYKNMDSCDGLDVTLTGKVTNIGYYTSSKGHDYTIFWLDDEKAPPIKVFSYTKLPISNENTVRVRGTYHKVLHKGNYTFYNEITTSPNNIFIVKSGNLGLKAITAIILIIFIIAISFGYRKYKKKKDLKANKYEIGTVFEKYVLSLFDPKDWILKESAGDLSRKLGRKVEIDLGPDFVFKHKDTNIIVAIQCKYRSKFFIGKRGSGIQWAQDYQIKNYNRFKEKEKYPFFIVIGVGREPSNPQQLFLVPLYALKYRFATRDYLLKFERDPKNKFTLEEFKIVKLIRCNIL